MLRLAFLLTCLVTCSGFVNSPFTRNIQPMLSPCVDVKHTTYLSSGFLSGPSVSQYSKPFRTIDGRCVGRRKGILAAGINMVAPAAESVLSALSTWPMYLAVEPGPSLATGNYGNFLFLFSDAGHKYIIVPDAAVRDATCSLGASLAAALWLSVWAGLSRAGVVDSKVSRKIVHLGSGPLFLLTWPLFSQTAMTPFIASVVPLVNAVRLYKAGTSQQPQATAVGKESVAATAQQDTSGLVSAISRSGRPDEVLQGPFVYTLVLAACTAFGWGSIPAISGITQMAAGDGMADLVGRRFGSVKWPWSRHKSIAGSMGFFLGASGVMLAEIAWFHAFGLTDVTAADSVMRVAIISALCTAVELIPLYKVFGIMGDDNITVPVAASILAWLLF